MTRTPVLFVSHAPVVAREEGGLGAALAGFAAATPTPRAILVVSSRWRVGREIGLTSAPYHKLIHDAAGSPPELPEVEWPAPGAPDVAARAAARLEAAGFRAILDPIRGLDHGAWLPLRVAWPAADVPVVESAMPAAEPLVLAGMGAALAPLRDEGVLLVASGGLVHDGEARPTAAEPPPEGWALEFDAWCAERIAALDVDGLARWREEAPHAERAVPAPELLDPLFVALGAAAPGDRAERLYDGIRHGNPSMRSFALQPGGGVAAA